MCHSGTKSLVFNWANGSNSRTFGWLAILHSSEYRRESCGSPQMTQTGLWFKVIDYPKTTLRLMTSAESARSCTHELWVNQLTGPYVWRKVQAFVTWVRRSGGKGDELNGDGSWPQRQTQHIHLTRYLHLFIRCLSHQVITYGYCLYLRSPLQLNIQNAMAMNS